MMYRTPYARRIIHTPGGKGHFDRSSSSVEEAQAQQTAAVVTLGATIVNFRQALRLITETALGLIFCLIVLTNPVWGSEDDPQSEDCLTCHDVIIDQENETYDNLLGSSIHADFSCPDCHHTIESLPHEDDLPAVDCGICHAEAVEEYECHGQLNAGATGDDTPTCVDCHGDHAIFAGDDPRSSVQPQNLPQTCGRCHDDIDLTIKHEILYDAAVDVFRSSVHGQATLDGSDAAATCNDCHGTGGSGHRICPPGKPDSPINHFNIPRTCGKCHSSIENDYWEGIHGKLALRGETGTPVCTDCHGEHGILPTDDPRSPVSSSRVAQATCEPCHESARLNEKYSIPTGRLQTFIDTYHGLKSEAGDINVANCASCHGAHRILPSSDSTSSIYPANLQETCGHCHPGISSAIATAPIHATPAVTQTPIANLVRQVYILLIILVIGGMTAFCLVDYAKRLKASTQTKQVVRMNRSELGQHTLLMLTFIVLVVSGFSLRFSEAWWARLIFGHEGGFAVRGLVHRVAAVLFFLTTVWHLVYLMSKRGRQFFRDMFPRLSDLQHGLQLLYYNLGRRSTPPRLGRFGFAEKAEYWALAWGSLIMIISGVFLWFDNYVVEVVSQGFLNVMLVFHYYEAWLAMLAIVIWHSYWTVFNPAVYPMNPTWLTGKMPRRMYEHEHEADPEADNSAKT